MSAEMCIYGTKPILPQSILKYIQSNQDSISAPLYKNTLTNRKVHLYPDLNPLPLVDLISKLFPQILFLCPKTMETDIIYETFGNTHLFL